jgi:hypothetical protein
MFSSRRTRSQARFANREYFIIVTMTATLEERATRVATLPRLRPLGNDVRRSSMLDNSRYSPDRPS